MLEDASQSFADYRPTVKALASDLASKLKPNHPGSYFGLGSFDDFPVSPFGLIRRTETIVQTIYEYQGGYVKPGQLGQIEHFVNAKGVDFYFETKLTPDGMGYVSYFVPDLYLNTHEVTVEIGPFDEGNAYVYRTHQPLTNDINLMLSKCDSITTQTQADGPEAQIEALLRVANKASEVGFRSDAAHFVVLSTDATYHQAGDGLAAGASVEYSTIATVKAALTSAKIIPIFAVTPDMMGTYQGVVNQLGIGAVVQLGADSTSLMNAMTASLNANTSPKELIGIVQGASGLDLSANYFSYI